MTIPSSTTTPTQVSVFTLPLEETAYLDTPHWVTPWAVRLTGNFKHNPGYTFRAQVFPHRTWAEKWFGVGNEGPHSERALPPGMIGTFAPEAGVIAAHPLPRQFYIALTVKPGDRLRTYLGLLEIRDDWRLHNPYLVKVED